MFDETAAAWRRNIPSGAFSDVLKISPFTILFAGVCIGLYLCMGIGGSRIASIPSSMLIAWGGNDRLHTIGSQPWRLLTSIFLHGSLLHLTMNAIALMDIGHLLEKKAGKLLTVLIFLLSGLTASLASVLWHPDSVSIGASGAIMGLAGALLVALAFPAPDDSGFVDRALQIRLLFIGVALTLSVGLFSQKVDNAAHIGGLGAGLFLGFCSLGLSRLRHRKKQYWSACGALAIFTLSSLGFVVERQIAGEYRFRGGLAEFLRETDSYNDVGRFLQTLQSSDPGSAVRHGPNRLMLSEAFAKANMAWKKCIDWTGAIGVDEPLALAPQQNALRGKLLSYCSLRKIEYELLDELSQRQQNGPLPVSPELLQYSMRANTMYVEMIPSIQRELESERQAGKNMK